MEYYSALKKKEILPYIPTWMNLEGIMLSKISQRKTTYDFTHMWHLRKIASKGKKNKRERDKSRNRLLGCLGW